MPSEIKEKIMKETNYNKIIEIESKYSQYLLDDEIIQHEIEVANIPPPDENYYIRKNK